MKINLIAVGSKMPPWVELGVKEYQKRLPRDFELLIREIPLSQRSKSTNLEKALAREGELSLQAVNKGDYLIALDVKGQSLSTEKMAAKIQYLRDEGRNVSLLVGGPDGLDKKCLQQADSTWSLSSLTFPHPVVRIVVAEQMYRVWSYLAGHPYHRG